MPRIVTQDLRNLRTRGTLPTVTQPRRSHSTQASVTMLQLILGTVTHRKQGQGRRLRARQAATNMHSRLTRSHTLRDRRRDKPGQPRTPSLQSRHIEMWLGSTHIHSTLKMPRLSRSRLGGIHVTDMIETREINETLEIIGIRETYVAMISATVCHQCRDRTVLPSVLSSPTSTLRQTLLRTRDDFQLTHSSQPYWVQQQVDWELVCTACP